MEEAELPRPMPDAQELLERERAARAAVERFAGRLMQLQSVTAALAEALTLDQVTAVIMGRVRDLLAASTCTVRLIDPAANTLDDVSSVGMPSGTREQYRSIPLSTPVPVVQAATEGRSFFFESLDALLADYPQLAEGVQRLGLQSFVVLPLSLQNQPLGSLSLTFEEPRNFEPEDRALLGSVASQCAQAIERARLYAKAQEAVRVRDSFIAIASHDLRGPITVLLGQAELLARRAEGAGVEPRLLTSAQTIAQQATRLERMIASLLDFSQIAAGQLTLALAPLDLHDLLRRLAEGLQPTLTQHTLALDADGPAPLLGDEVRLEQVFYNLIGNAVKYSPAGGTIRLRLWRERGQHCVEVSDEGLGIPADALPYLFDQFYRAPNVASGTIVGMGLGLYLVREIVDRHGGQVSASSVEGRGSTFTVLLPAE